MHLSRTGRTARALRALAVVLCTTLAAGGALSRAASATITGDAVDRYAGSYASDAGGRGPVVLDLLTRSGPAVTARLSIGGTRVEPLAGTLTDAGRLDLAGGVAVVRGQMLREDAAGRAVPSIIEARYLAVVGGKKDTGALAVVRQAAIPPVPRMEYRWEGGATVDGEKLSMTAAITAKAGGGLAATVTLGGDTFDATFQPSLTGETATFASAGAGSKGLLVLAGGYTPGKRVPHTLDGSLWLLGPGGGELALVGGGPMRSGGFRLEAQIPPPTFEIDATLKPERAGLPPFKDGKPRPLARMVDGTGVPADFVQDELIVQTADTTVLDAFVVRRKGQVLRTIMPTSGKAPYYVVRISPALADPARMVADLRKLDPYSRGHHRVSNAEGLGLLAASAAEAAAGLRVGINFVAESYSHLTLWDEVATEAPSGPSGYSNNPFSWSYMDLDDGPRTGVAWAWKLLQLAGKLSNRVKIAVIDGGFQTTNPDYPAATSGADGVANQMGCANSPCPWHGTAVAQTAAGVADNGWGTAGAGGVVGDLTLIRDDGGMDAHVAAVYQAIGAGARIINMSFGGSVPATYQYAVWGFEDATEDARDQGLLVFAAAGNSGIDVDGEDCFGGCWEERWYYPCENNGVLCVGGLADDTDDRHPSSNYGYESCGSEACDVEFFGPFRVYAGTDPQNPTNTARWVSGTSFASPFVAGMAALVWAAKPSLSDDQVEAALHESAHDIDGVKVSDIPTSYAVRKALGNIAPVAEIGLPAGPVTVPYGGWNEVSFAGTAYDHNPCGCAYEWTSNVDGVLSHALSFQHAFDTPGSRTVTFKATDGGGWGEPAKNGTDSVTVNAVNVAPAPVILTPAPNATLTKGVVYTLQGEVTDVNEPGAPCSYLTWTSSSSADTFGPYFPAAGCQPQVVFTTTGLRTITLTATDEYGATQSTFRHVNVVEPPANSPPVVSIVNPAPGAYVQPNTPVLLDGSVAEPDGDAITYSWTVKIGSGPEKQIGTTLDKWWTPSSDVPFNCGGQQVTLKLSGTDKDGTGTASVNVTVVYDPC
jgi:subtilisin family serine protease